jgi:sterol 3beta-glucosyltransferase
MITILCAGSRGDIQPYLALAVEIKKLEKDVRIAAPQEFGGLIQSYAIDFHPVGGDYEATDLDPEMIRQAQKADNPLKMFLSFQKMKQYGIHMVDDYYAACKGSDMIVYHPGVTTGYFLAEKFDIPSVLATYFPINRTKARPAVILYGKVKPSPLINAVSYTMLQKMLWMTSEASLKPFWKEKFGRLPKHFGAPFERHIDPRHPAVVSCSNAVFPRPVDWNEHIHQYGYWFLEERQEYTPSPELAEFLARGEKPVYIGFGSMFDKAETEKVMKIILEGISRTGRRAIINGFGDLDHLPERIFAVNGIPHSWLFERVSAVCHHGGAGTTAAGFKARKQFPMAFGDNFDGVVDHFDGGLVINRVGRYWNLGSHSFHVGRGTFRVVLVIQVRKHRKVNQSQPLINDEGRIRVVVRLSENRGRHHTAGAHPHIDRLAQRRQEVCQSGLPHPAAQIQDIPAIHQQGVSLLDSSDPILFFDAGQGVSSSTPNDFQPNSHMGLAVDPLMNR